MAAMAVGPASGQRASHQHGSRGSASMSAASTNMATATCSGILSMHSGQWWKSHVRVHANWARSRSMSDALGHAKAGWVLSSWAKWRRNCM